MTRIKISFSVIILIVNYFCALATDITAKFSYSKRSNCAPAVVDFTNESSTGSGITYTWNFGTGSEVSTTEHSAKTQLYSKPGTYTVTLTVSDGTNSSVSSTNITIAEGPKAAFSASPQEGCAPLTVSLTSISTAGDASISSTSWDLHNGIYSSGSSLSYTYTSAGRYDVILKVTDTNGCSSTVESDSFIHVVANPIANFTASDTFACTPPLKVSYKNLSSGSSDLTYNWDFGNSTTSTEVSQSVVYKANGNYNVKLSVTDIYGCSSSITKKSYINIGSISDSILVYDSNLNAISSTRLCTGTYIFYSSLKTFPDYTWKFTEDGKTTTITNCDSAIYQVSGTGTLSVELVYGKTTTCPDSISISFTKSSVKADFSLDNSTFCSFPKDAGIQNNSENASTYAWYLSGKLFSTSESPSLTIQQSDLPATTYEQLYSHKVDTVTLPVKLLVYNAEGCLDSVTHTANVSFPVARFMPDKVSGCLPLTVSLMDSSVSAYAITKYTYLLNNSTIGNTANVSYTFDQAGVYYVSEIIKSGECIDTSQVIKITVGDKLIPDFTVSPTQICNGGQIQITGTSNNNSAVNAWYLTSPDVFYLTSATAPDTSLTILTDSLGTKDVTLSVDYNGCISETTKTAAYEVKGVKGNFTETFSCDSALVYKFKSNITPSASLSWKIDTAHYTNVDSLYYKFPKSGDYTAKFTATDGLSGCSLSESKTIQVRQIEAAFTLNDSTFCTKDTVWAYSDSSVDYINSCYNEGFLWNFDDGAPQRTYKTSSYHVYKKKGTYTILLVAVADNGCVDSTSTTIHVYKPEAVVSADTTSGCLPSLTVNFTKSTIDSTIMSSIWTFGDNLTYSTGNDTITHIYTSDIQKTYNATLTVTDSFQCYSNYNISIKLNGVKADFQADDNAICLGQTVSFEPVDSSLQVLYWKFGDGDSSAVVSQHAYNQYGDFDVTLIGSKGGCTDTLTKSKYVNVEQPIADFTVSDSILSCYPDTVTFVRSKLGSELTDLTWTFDSRKLSTNSDSIQYTFTKPGTYQTSLTVTTLNGCKASASKKIEVSGPSGTFSFSPKSICYNDLVSFTVDSLDLTDSWVLNFGDGDTSSYNPVTHRYTTRGSLVPFISLTSKNCTVNKTTDTLYVSTTMADFEGVGDTANVCYGSTFNLTNTSQNSNYWVWKINDATKAVDFNLNDVSISTIGDYYIQLIATGTDNCTDTMTKKYTVVAAPQFSISGDSVICQDASSTTLTVSQEDGWSIAWTPTETVNNASSFTVNVSPSETTTYTATVTTSDGCTGSAEKTVTVNEPASYTRSPAGDTTIVSGTSIQLLIQVDNSSVTYSWSPNYNISCTDCNNPNVSPLKTTTYVVNITNGCFDFDESFKVEVLTDYYLEAPSAFTPNGDGNNDVFKFNYKNISSFELKIYNRWGKLVYSGTDVDSGWDGTVNGTLQNIDSYSYIVKAQTTSGTKIEKQGNFLLLK
jgi:gliding motility-associated-like protein